MSVQPLGCAEVFSSLCVRMGSLCGSGGFLQFAHGTSRMDRLQVCSWCWLLDDAGLQARAQWH